MPRKAALQKAETEPTAFGLAMPGTTIGAGWATTRLLKLRGKMFLVFGDRNEAPGELTLTVQPPISAGMVHRLCFLRQGAGCYLQHDWVIARFSAGDDIKAEMPTLKAWMTQSDCVMAPRGLAQLVRGPEQL